MEQKSAATTTAKTRKKIEKDNFSYQLKD